MSEIDFSNQNDGSICVKASGGSLLPTFNLYAKGPFYEGVNSNLNKNLFSIESSSLQLGEYQEDRTDGWKGQKRHEGLDHWFDHALSMDKIPMGLEIISSINSSTEVLCGISIKFKQNSVSNLDIKGKELQYLDLDGEWFVFDPNLFSGQVIFDYNGSAIQFKVFAPNDQFCLEVKNIEDTYELVFWASKNVMKPILTANFFKIQILPVLTS